MKKPTDYNVRIYRRGKKLHIGFVHKLVRINRNLDEWKTANARERKALAYELLTSLEV